MNNKGVDENASKRNNKNESKHKETCATNKRIAKDETYLNNSPILTSLIGGGGGVL